MPAQPLKALFEKFLAPPRQEGARRPRGFLRPWLREVHRRAPEIAASEGYFSIVLDIDFDEDSREQADSEEGDREQVTIRVEPGPRTVVRAVGDRVRRRPRRRRTRAREAPRGDPGGVDAPAGPAFPQPGLGGGQDEARRGPHRRGLCRGRDRGERGNRRRRGGERRPEAHAR